MMLVLLATIGVLAYATFIFRPSHHGDLLPFALVVTAETWLIAQALLALWTILSSGYDARDFSYHEAKRGLFEPGRILAQGLEETPSQWPMQINEEPVSVDVFVTTYGEDLDVIRRTVAAALAIRGRHRTLVLDDGRSDDVRDLADRAGRGVRPPTRQPRRQSRQHQPRALDHHGEFFAVFDADFAPSPEFLHETLPYFATDKVAFVQTPQTYGNLHTVLSRGSGYMQSVFYLSSSRARTASTRRSAWGPTSIFRRNASPTSAASTSSRSPRTSGPRSTCTSAVGAPSTPARCWRSVPPRRRSRPTASSSCAGPPAPSRSCSGTTR